MSTVEVTSTPPTSTNETESTHKEVIENTQPESQLENDQQNEDANRPTETDAAEDGTTQDTGADADNTTAPEQMETEPNKDEAAVEPAADDTPAEPETSSDATIPQKDAEPAVGEQPKVEPTEQMKNSSETEKPVVKTDKKPEEDVKTDDKKPDSEKTDSEEASCSKPGTSSAGAAAEGQSESIYHIKWVYFKKKLVPIITQNENGPCPLLAIMNVLLLQNRVKLAAATEIISATQLMVYLGDCVLENVPGDDGVSTPARLNFEQNMSDAMAVMPKLQTGLDVNVRFTGISHFEYTSECIIFDLLQIALYHGWLVDPQNASEVRAVGKCSYNQLVEKIITDKTSDDSESVNQALIAEQFLAMSASMLTYHGLCELGDQLKDDELAVLFRNNHFTTLYRHKNELFQLVTDHGFLNETNVVWETLNNVEGDGQFVDSEFRTYTKPEASMQPVQAPNVALNSDEQIDQDYLVALSLQQEQQQDPGAWGQSAAPMTDLELAQTLQEEERRAAEDAQRQQAVHQQQMAGRNNNNNGGGGGAGGGAAQGQAQRRQNRGGADRGDREEKKSDSGKKQTSTSSCQIL